MTLSWLSGLVRRRPGRLLATALGVALAVGLLGSIGTFLSSSKGVMTQRAAASVAVAWQVEAQRGADPTAVFQRVLATPNVMHPMPVEFGQTAGFTLTKEGTTQTTGKGVVLGVPNDYVDEFPDAIRPLVGTSHGVLLAQQTAANLHAAVGDTVTFQRPGLPDVKMIVDGIVDVPSADSLFQHVGAPSSSQPTAPPDNVALLPSDNWHRAFDPVRSTRPDLITTQVHADFSAPLPSDPSAAYANVVAAGNNLELALAGTGLLGNNLAAELGKARSDALYAQMLFLFLGLPGAVLAGLLTATIATSGADRRRRDQALLRTRGARARQLVSLGVGEALLVGIIGAAAGTAIAAFIGLRSFGSATFGATSSTALSWGAGSVVVGLVIALLAIAWPAWRDARDITVASARHSVGRVREPRWMRWYVDVLLIAGSLVVFWSTSRNGYKLVLAVEGVTSVSVNYWAFLGPAMAWVGGAMLIWRFALLALRRGRRTLAWLLRPFVGGLATTVAASMSRQRRMLARGLSLVALTSVFAGSTAVFNSTYNVQAEVDAVLSNGAMVSVVHSPGQEVLPDKAAALAAVPGVRSVTALQHRYAYVGADLQDLFGVDPNTIVKATKLRDSYFQGGTANALMATLARQPNAVLVSQETVKDFQLNRGDTINLRLLNTVTKQYRPVRFVYVGITNEFPTAPSDSFLIANASYIAAETGSAAVGTFLLDTAARDSTAVSRRVQTLVGTDGLVHDIASKRRKIGNSLTSVELGGLTKVELGFALVLAAAASGLVLWLGLTERKRTFAIAAALGARPRQVAGFIWSEAFFVTVGGLFFGTIAGWAITEMIVKVLKGVFDPPPSSLAVPFGYLSTVGAIVVGAVLLATATVTSATRKPTIEMLRDL
jgi:putative ABC transport system permease protein